MISISCLESKLLNNNNWYGRFQLAPFQKGQGLTIANALRRTLLAEKSHFYISWVDFFNAEIPYSVLTGMRESIFDILLNLKQVVFTSDVMISKPPNTINDLENSDFELASRFSPSISPAYFNSSVPERLNYNVRPKVVQISVRSAVSRDLGKKETKAINLVSSVGGKKPKGKFSVHLKFKTSRLVPSTKPSNSIESYIEEVKKPHFSRGYGSYKSVSPDFHLMGSLPFFEKRERTKPKVAKISSWNQTKSNPITQVDGDKKPSSKTFVAYICAKGPAVIHAKDIKLPKGLKCVDPEKLIVTLADDGLFYLRFAVSVSGSFFSSREGVVFSKGKKQGEKNRSPPGDRWGVMSNFRTPTGFLGGGSIVPEEQRKYKRREDPFDGNSTTLENRFSQVSCLGLSPIPLGVLPGLLKPCLKKLGSKVNENTISLNRDYPSTTIPFFPVFFGPSGLFLGKQPNHDQKKQPSKKTGPTLCLSWNGNQGFTPLRDRNMYGDGIEPGTHGRSVLDRIARKAKAFLANHGGKSRFSSMLHPFLSSFTLTPSPPFRNGQYLNDGRGDSVGRSIEKIKTQTAIDNQAFLPENYLIKQANDRFNGITTNLQKTGLFNTQLNHSFLKSGRFDRFLFELIKSSKSSLKQSYRPPSRESKKSRIFSFSNIQEKPINKPERILSSIPSLNLDFLGLLPVLDDRRRYIGSTFLNPGFEKSQKRASSGLYGSLLLSTFSSYQKARTESENQKSLENWATVLLFTGERNRFNPLLSPLTLPLLLVSKNSNPKRHRKKNRIIKKQPSPYFRSKPLLLTFWRKTIPKTPISDPNKGFMSKREKRRQIKVKSISRVSLKPIYLNIDGFLNILKRSTKFRKNQGIKPSAIHLTHPRKFKTLVLPLPTIDKKTRSGNTKIDSLHKTKPEDHWTFNPVHTPLVTILLNACVKKTEKTRSIGPDPNFDTDANLGLTHSMFSFRHFNFFRQYSTLRTVDPNNKKTEPFSFSSYHSKMVFPLRYVSPLKFTIFETLLPFFFQKQKRQKKTDPLQTTWSKTQFPFEILKKKQRNGIRSRFAHFKYNESFKIYSHLADFDDSFEKSNSVPLVNNPIADFDQRSSPIRRLTLNDVIEEIPSVNASISFLIGYLPFSCFFPYFFRKSRFSKKITPRKREITKEKRMRSSWVDSTHSFHFVPGISNYNQTSKPAYPLRFPFLASLEAWVDAPQRVKPWGETMSPTAGPRPPRPLSGLTALSLESRKINTEEDYVFIDQHGQSCWWGRPRNQRVYASANPSNPRSISPWRTVNRLELNDAFISIPESLNRFPFSIPGSSKALNKDFQIGNQWDLTQESSRLWENRSKLGTQTRSESLDDDSTSSLKKRTFLTYCFQSIHDKRILWNSKKILLRLLTNAIFPLVTDRKLSIIVSKSMTSQQKPTVPLYSGTIDPSSPAAQMSKEAWQGPLERKAAHVLLEKLGSPPKRPIKERFASPNQTSAFPNQPEFVAIREFSFLRYKIMGTTLFSYSKTLADFLLADARGEPALALQKVNSDPFKRTPSFPIWWGRPMEAEHFQSRQNKKQSILFGQTKQWTSDKSTASSIFQETQSGYSIGEKTHHNRKEPITLPQSGPRSSNKLKGPNPKTNNGDILSPEGLSGKNMIPKKENRTAVFDRRSQSEPTLGLPGEDSIQDFEPVSLSDNGKFNTQEKAPAYDRLQSDSKRDDSSTIDAQTQPPGTIDSFFNQSLYAISTQSDLFLQNLIKTEALPDVLRQLSWQADPEMKQSFETRVPVQDLASSFVDTKTLESKDSKNTTLRTPGQSFFKKTFRRKSYDHDFDYTWRKSVHRAFNKVFKQRLKKSSPKSDQIFDGSMLPLWGIDLLPPLPPCFLCSSGTIDPTPKKPGGGRNEDITPHRPPREDSKTSSNWASVAFGPKLGLDTNTEIKDRHGWNHGFLRKSQNSDLDKSNRKQKFLISVLNTETTCPVIAKKSLNFLESHLIPSVSSISRESKAEFRSFKSSWILGKEKKINMALVCFYPKFFAHFDALWRKSKQDHDFFSVFQDKSWWGRPSLFFSPSFFSYSPRNQFTNGYTTVSITQNELDFNTTLYGQSVSPIFSYSFGGYPFGGIYHFANYDTLRLVSRQAPQNPDWNDRQSKDPSHWLLSEKESQQPVNGETNDLVTSLDMDLYQPIWRIHNSKNAFGHHPKTSMQFSDSTSRDTEKARLSGFNQGDPDQNNLNNLKSYFTINQSFDLINKVNYIVENHSEENFKRDLQDTPGLENEKEYIQIDLWTNGSLTPRQALSNAFKRLLELFHDLNKYHLLKPIER